MSHFGVSHVAIGVRDIDKVLPFYINVLGLQVTADYVQEVAADQAVELHGGRHILRRQVWLRQSKDRHATAVTLDQLMRPVPADHRAEIYDLGVHHVGFWVDDVEAIVERAKRGGHPIIMPHTSPPQAYGDDSDGRIASVFLRDPEGNLIQCDQRIRQGELAHWWAGGTAIKESV